MSSDSSSREYHFRPDLKVGKLARLAISTYIKSINRDPEEIQRLQDGEYCHRTFLLNTTMPVLVPVSAIEDAPDGASAGEAGFYNAHYWSQVYVVNDISYRIVNDWKEPPNPRDNRTPLEDWIRRMGIDL